MNTTRPGPPVRASGEGWTVVIDMPVFETGKDRGRPVGWLNLNTMSRMHWSKRDKIKDLWRKAAYKALAAKRLPKGLGRVRVQIELRCSTNRIRDVPNYEGTFKPVIDALQPMKTYRRKKRNGRYEDVTEWGVGLIAGDDARYLERTASEGEPLGRNHKSKGQVILRITPIPDEEAAA